MDRTKVYYNSACPVCNAGVKYQRRILSEQESDIDWIDVHMNNGAECEIDTDLESIRERLHVVDENGVIHIGSEAFAELWKRNKIQKPLSFLIRLPFIRTVCGRLYNKFAAILYRWNRSRNRW